MIALRGTRRKPAACCRTVPTLHAARATQPGPHMNKTLLKRIALTIPIIAVVPLLLLASLPIEEWSIGVGVAMVCAMCVFGLYSIWTRPAAMMVEEAAQDDGGPVSTRWTGVREDRRGLFR